MTYFMRVFPLKKKIRTTTANFPWSSFPLFFHDLSKPDADNFLFSAAYARPVKSQSGGGGRMEEGKKKDWAL